MGEGEQLTAEQQQAAAEVSTAAAEAIATADSPEQARERAREAISSTAQRVQIEISDEDANKLADVLIERMSALGAFDPPPAPAAAAPSTPEVAAREAAEQAQAARPPEKKTFAERFAGL